MAKKDHDELEHCNGFGCLKKYRCYRYTMHLEARRKEMHWLKYLHPVVCQDNGYNKFKELE